MLAMYTSGESLIGAGHSRHPIQAAKTQAV